MFKLSLPVQRFVALCIFMMVIITIADVNSDTFWNWYENAADITTAARSF